MTYREHDIRILIIVPAFNESGNIGPAVKEILAVDSKCCVLVINDGSTDQTAKEAKTAGARVVSLPFNLGIGGAVQTGFQYARMHDFDAAVQIDGDGQHDPRFLAKLIAPIAKKEADMTIGSRFLPPYSAYQSSFIRRIGIHFFTNLICGLTGCRLTDPTSGFRAYNRQMIYLFASDYPHDFPEPEAIVMARLAEARILEVPVEMRERIHGLSSIRYARTLYYMIKVTFAICLDMLKRKRRFIKWG